jgi:hypothetical protein
MCVHPAGASDEGWATACMQQPNHECLHASALMLTDMLAYTVVLVNPCQQQKGGRVGGWMGGC